MAFLQLRNLGKIYVTDNSVAVGIRGVSLDFDIGEFVAVTGKSGSGKTTLLNCISGMDSYEEGEIYIDGGETSHFTQQDWEEYRQKYISFVFQDYNIIDSFTVLQNVELALTHIDSRRERRKRALELIDRVGMTSHKNCKGSKLSGGQKQRTVIARALAKDSPIILADEPTGNLDSKTGEEIVELLHEISRDKLVIVVTHSLSQFEAVATREIRIYDGGIERDEQIKPANKKAYVEQEKTKRKRSDMSLGFELGRHKFFSSPKMSIFMCIVMIVALFGCFFTTANNLAGEGILELFDITDDLFTYSKGRVIVSKYDGGVITEEELDELKEKTGAKKYIHYDMLYESPSNLSISSKILFYLFDEDLYCEVLPDKFKVDVGRLPENGQECVLYVPVSWQEIFGIFKMKERTIPLFSGFSTIDVVGVKYYYDQTNTPHIYLNGEGFAYVTDVSTLSGDNKYTYATMYMGGSQDIYGVEFQAVGVDHTLMGKEFYIMGKQAYETENNIGDIVISQMQYTSMGYSSVQKEHIINTSSGEYKYRSDKNVFEVVSPDVYMYYESVLMISPEMAREAAQTFEYEDYTQASLFFKNDFHAAKAKKELADLGYAGIVSNEKYDIGDGSALLGFIIESIRLITWAVTILFLTFFLSLCTVRILAAGNSDLAIMRSMGINNRIIKVSMYARMLMASVPAVLLLAIFAPTVYLNPIFSRYLPFLEPSHYALMLVGFFALVMFVTHRSNKRMFRSTVIKTLRGGGRA